MRKFLILWCVLAPCVPAQDSAPASPQPAEDTSRVLGVIPSNRIVPKTKPEELPLSASDKFKLATKDSTDPFTFVAAGFYAGIAQWQNDYPAFGLGASGYGKRYGAALADQVSENYMTEGIFPSLFHQDPRYFRKRTGSWHSRVAYALSRSVITRNDDGGRAVNISEIGGAAAAAALSTVYYPAGDRTVGEVSEKVAFQIAGDSGFNLLLEFWPDIRHKFLHK